MNPYSFFLECFISAQTRQVLKQFRLSTSLSKNFLIVSEYLLFFQIIWHFTKQIVLLCLERKSIFLKIGYFGIPILQCFNSCKAGVNSKNFLSVLSKWHHLLNFIFRILVNVLIFKKQWQFDSKIFVIYCVRCTEFQLLYLWRLPTLSVGIPEQLVHN